MTSLIASLTLGRLPFSEVQGVFPFSDVPGIYLYLHICAWAPLRVECLACVVSGISEEIGETGAESFPSSIPCPLLFVC